MTNSSFCLRNVAMTACLAVAVLVSGCEKDPEEENPNNPPTPTNAVELTSPITADKHLPDLGLDVDYFYNGTSLLEVKNNAKLTIDPDVTIQFRQTDGGLEIKEGAMIKALGLPKLLDAQDNVVVVNGVELDGHIKFIGATNNKGSWSGVVISTTVANELNYVEILNAGSGTSDYSSALYLNNGKADLNHCLIDRSSSNGITIKGRSDNQVGELRTFANCTISNCDKAPIFTYEYMGCYGLRNILPTTTLSQAIPMRISISAIV